MYGIEHKVVAISFSIMLLVQACIIRRVVGTFIFPAALFSLVWFFYTFIPLILLFDAPINAFAIGFILLCSTAFTLGALPFSWRTAVNKNRNKAFGSLSRFRSGKIAFCLSISSVLALVFTTLGMASNGVNFESMANDLSAASGSYAARRGQEQLEYYGFVGVLSYLFTNIAPAFGALLLSTSCGWRRYLIIAGSFCPALYMMLTQSTKLILLTATFVFIATHFLVKIYRNEFGLFRVSTFVKTMSLATLTLPLISYSLLTRGAFSNYNNYREMFANIVYGLNTYILGQIYAFSDFFSYYTGMDSSHPYKDDFNTLGYYTFKAVFDSFGGTKVFPPGYYEESYSYGGSFETNIFTIFRSLIHDFGGFGTCFFFVIAGFWVHYFYYNVLRYRNAWFSCVVYVISVVAILLSYLFSIFTSRYMVLVGAVLYAVLFVNDKLAGVKWKHRGHA